MDRLILKENVEEIQTRIWSPGEGIVCGFAYHTKSRDNFSIFSWRPRLNGNKEDISRDHKPNT